MKKTILVTGGAGFIGSHLCLKLLEQNYFVICLDNLFTGNKNNIESCFDFYNFEFIRHDIIKPILLEVDMIYHLACPASPVHYQYNPVKTIKTSIHGTINMLGLAKRVDSKILLSSTSEVYGDPLEHPQKEEYWGNVNPIGPRSCFSDDTEVLTLDGWKLFSEVSKQDSFATINKNHELEFQPPTEIIQEDYDNELLHFENYNIDLSVTPNHQMYVRKRNHDAFNLYPANEKFSWHRSQMLKTCTYSGDRVEYFYFPKELKTLPNQKTSFVEKIKMNDWLEFLGYFISEGMVYIAPQKKNIAEKEYETTKYRIHISQSEKKKQDNFNKIKSCLDRLPFNYCISKSNNSYFVITNKQLAIYLKEYLGLHNSYQMYIPRQFMNLHKEQLKILFDALILGDGSISKKTGSISYYSTSIKLMSDIQELGLKLGLFTNIKKTKGRNTLYCHFSSRNCCNYPKPKKHHYQGKIYCVTVPNHTIFVRRNGKAVFCGNCYDEGKRVAETLMMDYHRQNNVNIRIARIFNTFGPNMMAEDGRVISNFIVQALQNQPITIYGDGSQTRSFCYVSDTVDGLIALMNSSITTPVNIGNPDERTILDIAKLIIKLTNSNSTIVFKDMPVNDPKKRKPDITKAKTELNWEPIQTNLEKCIYQTINYFQDELDL